jgi:hypothetical protein
LIFGSFHQGKEQSQPAAIERADVGIVKGTRLVSQLFVNFSSSNKKFTLRHVAGEK